MEHPNWSCFKCNSKRLNVGEMRVSGSFWSRIFDMQNKKYSAVTCHSCGYAEFYKRPASSLGNIFDFITN
ncbi:zinc ribbon domain-containing protein [Verrucomicrobia bacterium]|nr:zinc ribbon domain-containing protein [Verrucomicrobiota bacterium]